MMDVKKIEWSEESLPNEDISYNHIIGQTPLGDYQITWKGWKSHPSYDIEHTNFGWLSSEPLIDLARHWAESHFEHMVMGCLQDESTKKEMESEG